MIQLIGNRPAQEYEKWLLDLMNGAEGSKIRGVVVVAILEEPLPGGGDAMVAYFNVNRQERYYASDLIREDIVVDIVKDAINDALGLEPSDAEEG